MYLFRVSAISLLLTFLYALILRVGKSSILLGSSVVSRKSSPVGSSSMYNWRIQPNLLELVLSSKKNTRHLLSTSIELILFSSDKYLRVLSIVIGFKKCNFKKGYMTD